MSKPKSAEKAGKPKRDPNQPLPKPRKRGSLILKVVVVGVLLVGGAYGTLFYMTTGKLPWEAPSEFADFSRQEMNEAVASVDWEALKGKITEKTKQLYDNVPGLEQKLDATLARLRGGDQASGDQAAAGGKTEGAKTEGQPPAAVAPRPPTTYEQGCLTLRDAIQTYKRSVKGKGDRRSDKEMQQELRKAKGQFQSARELLEKAHGEAEAGGDPKQAEEIEGVLQSCNTYLEDCSKRETL